MNFRTPVNIEPGKTVIDHNDAIFSLGSCFAENIAEKLAYYKFTVLNNPFGVLYNPASIAAAIRLISDKKNFTKDDLVFHNEAWRSFYHDSRFSHPQWEECLENINRWLTASRRFLKRASHLIITYGTAYVFIHKERREIVANCHKMPAKIFRRHRLTVTEAAKYISKCMESVKKFNPRLQLIFSISPVRHLKDGAVNNQRSKAVLLLALEEAIAGNDRCHYFPAYEIMMDELRDYRFYDTKMVQPAQTAVDYIWEKFAGCYLSKDTASVLRDIHKLQQAVAHRPLNSASPGHQRFIVKQLELIKELEKKYPHLNFDHEINHFLSQKF